ncbi:Uncharacterized conserved protein [Clostridioides difficile]|nr:Uncharacterized conserved protein [Clostridioides difficile]
MIKEARNLFIAMVGATTMTEIKPLTKDDIYGILQEFDFISKEEFNELKDRISDIEEKLKDK